MSSRSLLLVRSVDILVCLSLIVCVYSRAFGSHHGSWRPGARRHNFPTGLLWDPVLKRREQLFLAEADRPDLCCPTDERIVQPEGGVSKSGRILELYHDQNSTQSFYVSVCKKNVRGQACRYVDERAGKLLSTCVQKYSYTYALVREYHSEAPWRLDYIRIRTGCACEVRHHHRGSGAGRKRAARKKETLL